MITEKQIEARRRNGRLAVSRGQLSPGGLNRGSSRGGKITGPRNIGKLLAAATKETHSRGGKITGPRNIAKLLAVTTKETLSLGGKTAQHNRWHVARHKPNPKCFLCQEQ